MFFWALAMVSIVPTYKTPPKRIQLTSIWGLGAVVNLTPSPSVLILFVATVAELRELLDIDQVPMSQQLMRLRADGLVEARRDGTTVYYRITRPEVLTVIEALHSAFCPR